MRSLGDAQPSAADSCDPVEDAVQDLRARPAHARVRPCRPAPRPHPCPRLERAVSDTATLPELTREHREGFIDTLEGLAPDQWLVPSLCSEWRVLDVAAHLAWAPVLGAGAGVVAMARHGFSMNRMIAGSAVAWSARGPPR